jgi:hypothetical protein
MRVVESREASRGEKTRFFSKSKNYAILYVEQ